MKRAGTIIGSILLALVMMLTLLPTGVVATNLSVSNATELTNRVNEASVGDVIKLDADITMSEALTISKGKQLTLDLNGHVLTNDNGDTTSSAIVIDGGTITIADNSEDSTGKIVSAYGIVIKGNYGTDITSEGSILNITGGTIEVSQRAIDVKNRAKGAKINISGGTLVGKNQYGGAQIIRANGLDLEINITGGVLETYRAPIIYAQADDNVYINISGGTLKTGQSEVVSFSGGVNLAVSGDTRFETSQTSADIRCSSTDTISISSGEFSYIIPEEYLASGSTLKQRENVFFVIPPVAKIQNTGYATLADAVAAAQSGDTIELLRDCEGDGIALWETDKKSITIDLGGHTYNVSGKTVGSNGTETQAFHFEKENAVTIKNGTIKATSASAKMLIQNYSDMTLTDVVVDGRNLSGDSWYVVSNNYGEIIINGSTSIYAKDNWFALDSCGASGSWSGNTYAPGSNVTVNTTGVIDGKVESCSTMTIENGKFTKSVAAADCTSAPNPIVISGGYFTVDPGCYTKAGYRVSSGRWDIDEVTYSYKVTAIPDNKIDSAIATVKTSNDDASTTEDATVVVKSNKLEVSGKISASNKAIITYFCTDGKNGTVIVTYDTDCFKASPASVTVGSTIYTVDVSGMSVLPAEIKVAAPEITPPVVSDDATDSLAATEAAQAIISGADNISAAGLGAAVTAETVTTDSDNIPQITVGSGDTTETKTITEVINDARSDTNAPDLIKNPDAELVVVVQPVLNIEVKDVTTENGSQVLNLDISAQSQAIVTTTEVAADNIKTDGDGKNAVTVGDPVPVAVNTPVTITIPLPADFVADGSEDNVFVRHQMHNGAWETVKATYNSINKTITFTVNGMSPMNVITDARTCTIDYPDGTTATYRVSEVGTALPPATQPGYTFNGWTFANDVTGTYKTMTDDLLTALTGKTVTAIPQFTKKDSGEVATNYTLTFETNGGSKIANVSRSYGSTIDLTEYKPTRDGYSFAGWYSDSGLEESVTSVKLTTNTTVYAKWIVTMVNPFTDVADSSYYYDSVLWAVEKGVTTGKTATLFAPNDTCTRAQTVVFLWRAMGSPEPTTTTCQFTDINSGAYYYKAVLWAMEKGITAGTGADTFSPDTAVTRAQFMTFLWRAAGKLVVNYAMSFVDVEADSYYTEAVRWAASEGITTGTSADTFSPNEICTRAHIVTFLYRYLEK